MSPAGYVDAPASSHGSCSPHRLSFAVPSARCITLDSSGDHSAHPVAGSGPVESADLAPSGCRVAACSSFVRFVADCVNSVHRTPERPRIHLSRSLAPLKGGRRRCCAPCVYTDLLLALTSHTHECLPLLTLRSFARFGFHQTSSLLRALLTSPKPLSSEISPSKNMYCRPAPSCSTGCVFR